MKKINVNKAIETITNNASNMNHETFVFVFSEPFTTNNFTVNGKHKVTVYGDTITIDNTKAFKATTILEDITFIGDYDYKYDAVKVDNGYIELTTWLNGLNIVTNTKWDKAIKTTVKPNTSNVIARLKAIHKSRLKAEKMAYAVRLLDNIKHNLFIENVKKGKIAICDITDGKTKRQLKRLEGLQISNKKYTSKTKKDVVLKLSDIASVNIGISDILYQIEKYHDLYNSYDLDLLEINGYDTTVDIDILLYRLSIATVASVLRRLIFADTKKKYTDLRRELFESKDVLEKVITVSNLDHNWEINTKGKMQYCINTLNDVLHNKMLAISISDSFDLIHNAFLWYKENIGKKPYNYSLGKAVNITIPNPKRRIKEGDKSFVTIETSAFIEACKVVRREIASHSGLQDDKIIWIDEIIKDGSGKEYSVYKEYEYKYMAYTMPDGTITVDSYSVERAKELIDGLYKSLSVNQKTVIDCRLKHGVCGAKAIATATGLSVDSVKSALKQVKAKAEKYYKSLNLPLWSERTKVVTTNDILTPIDFSIGRVQLPVAK